MSMQPYKSPAVSSGQVNERLHTLRGEHFRRERNMRGARALLPSLACRLPTLSSVYDHQSAAPSVQTSPATAASPRAPPKSGGHGAPKSWVKDTISHTDDVHFTPEWRQEALAPLVAHCEPLLPHPCIPALTALCARVLLQVPDLEHHFIDQVVDHLPPHVRRDLVRHTAVHDPLPIAVLSALCHGGAAYGEVIVVGPASSPRTQLFDASVDGLEPAAHSWDSPLTDSDPSSLRTVAIMTATLRVATLLTFPPTITSLALLHVSAPVPVYRLSGLCPSLVFLDLSFNDWLDDKVLDAVDWKRLSKLGTLCLRLCPIDKPSLEWRVNRSRWDDVTFLLQ